MASTLSPSTQDSLNGLNARMELNMVEVLAKSYGEGFVKAAEALEAKPHVTRDDSKLLREDVSRLTKPIQDYNKALAGKVDEIVRDSFAAGKSDTEVAKILRARIPEILNNEPITIQRPGKRPVSFTADDYADMVANVVPYAVRNEGYIRGLKEAGADGWISVATGDERMCPMCGEKNGQVYGWEDPKPPYHPGPCRCRPVAYFRPKTKEDLAESERIKAKVLEKPWEKTGIPASSADEVAEQLIDDIIPAKMAYPGSTIERPKLDKTEIDVLKSETVVKYTSSNEHMNAIKSKGEDVILKEMVHEIGFDGAPTKVSAKELTKIVDDGGIELYRGLSKKEMVESFKYGDYYAGRGIYGNGIYTGYGEYAATTASVYAGPEDGTLLRLVLDKNAKIIKIDDVGDLINEQKSAIAKEYGRRKLAISADDADALKELDGWRDRAETVLSDPGRVAALSGYDAIDISNEQYINVLNRNAVYVQKDIITQDQLKSLVEIDNIAKTMKDYEEFVKEDPTDEFFSGKLKESKAKINELRSKIKW